MSHREAAAQSNFIHHEQHRSSEVFATTWLHKRAFPIAISRKGVPCFSASPEPSLYQLHSMDTSFADLLMTPLGSLYQIYPKYRLFKEERKKKGPADVAPEKKWVSTVSPEKYKGKYVRIFVHQAHIPADSWACVYGHVRRKHISSSLFVIRGGVIDPRSDKSLARCQVARAIAPVGSLSL
jgi:hypothetical protein